MFALCLDFDLDLCLLSLSLFCDYLCVLAGSCVSVTVFVVWVVCVLLMFVGYLVGFGCFFILFGLWFVVVFWVSCGWLVLGCFD